MKKNSQAGLVLAILIGNIIEWYSFSIFMRFMPWFSHSIFYSSNTHYQCLLALILFIATFILRPVGGVFFGYYADRYSRVDSLIASIVFMIIPTTLMALLPLKITFLHLSAIAMILCRSLQGLTAGGEFATSIVYAVEKAPAPLRGFYGSLPAAGGFLGILLAQIVLQIMTTYLSAAQILSIGWRLVFLLPLPLGIWGYFLRKHVRESQAFLYIKEVKNEAIQPFWSSLKIDYKMVLFTCLASALIFTAIHGMVLNMSHYLHETLPRLIPKLNIIDFSLSVMIVLCPLAGLLSDFIGRKIVYAIGCLGLILTAGPIFYLITQYGSWQSIFAKILLSIFIACLCGSMPALLAESFATSVRTRSLAISLNLSGAIFGALVPYASIWFSEILGSFIGAAAYIVIIALISFLAILSLPESCKRSLLTGHSY